MNLNFIKEVSGHEEAKTLTSYYYYYQYEKGFKLPANEFRFYYVGKIYDSEVTTIPTGKSLYYNRALISSELPDGTLTFYLETISYGGCCGYDGPVFGSAPVTKNIYNC